LTPSVVPTHNEIALVVAPNVLGFESVTFILQFDTQLIAFFVYADYVWVR
jgi:hypothetical protein